MTQTVNAPLARGSALVAREIRAELGRQQVSHRQLAERLGVSFMWVNRRISQLAVDLTVEDIQRIAAALAVPVQELIGGWLDYEASPNTAGIGASTVLSDTPCDENVVTFPVGSNRSSGAMRTAEAAAA